MSVSSVEAEGTETFYELKCYYSFSFMIYFLLQYAGAQHPLVYTAKCPFTATSERVEFFEEYLGKRY